MSGEVLFILNDNILWLLNLKNGLTGVEIEGASPDVTTIRDKAGAAAEGLAFPIAMTEYAAGAVTLPNGITYPGRNYYAILDKALTLVENRPYTAVVDVSVGGLDGHWELPVTAAVRDG